MMLQTLNEVVGMSLPALQWMSSAPLAQFIVSHKASKMFLLQVFRLQAESQRHKKERQSCKS